MHAPYLVLLVMKMLGIKGGTSLFLAVADFLELASSIPSLSTVVFIHGVQLPVPATPFKGTQMKIAISLTINVYKIF